MFQNYQPSYLLHDFNIQIECIIFEAFIEKNLVDIKCLLAHFFNSQARINNVNFDHMRIHSSYF